MAPGTEAVLLRAVDYRDADRILTFYTRERGRLSAIARGARRSRRRFAGALEPFCVVALGFGRGRGDLATLQEATVVRAFPGILGSLAGMREGGVGLDLLRRVTREEDADPRLFDAVIEFFERLGDRGLVAADVRLTFSVRVLSLVGMAPELETCALSGARCPPGQSAYFDPARGSIVRESLGGRGIRLAGSTREAIGRARGEGWGEVVLGERERRQAHAAIEAFITAQIR